MNRILRMKTYNTTEEISITGLLKLAGPVMLSQATVFLCGITDLIFIRRFGSVAISAVSIANVLSFTLLSFLEGLRTTTTVFISKSRAENKIEEASSTYSFALLIGSVIGIFFLVTAWPLSHQVFSRIGNGEYMRFGKEYLYYQFSAFPLFLLFMVLAGYFHGIHDTRSPLIATLIIGLLNGILDALFITGIAGWKGFGVPGSALASLLSHAAGVSYLGSRYYQLLQKKDPRGIPLSKPWKTTQQKYLKMCFEVGFYTGLMNLALFFFVGIINQLGPDALASHQVSFQIFLLSYLPGTGFMVAATILLPALQQKNKKQLLIQGVWRILKSSIILAAFVAAILEVSAPWIANFFLPGNPVAIGWTTHTLRIVGLIQLLSSIYLVLRGTLTALRDTRYIAVMGLITGYIIFLPMACLFTGFIKGGISGGYWAFLGWSLADVLFLGFRVLHQMKIPFFNLFMKKSIKSIINN